MNVREQIGRLETLLQRIQSHARARRDASLGERRPVLESYTSEAATASLEVVDSAPPEALEDDDVVEMSSDVLESVPPPAVAASAPPRADAESAPEVFAREELGETDLDFEDEEEPPASSKRHRITGTIDDAVSAREREPVLIQEGREVPLKTPPPESGPQEAPPPPGSLAPPPTPDISDLLDDLPPEPAVAAGPRPEQLGDTIELSEPVGPPLELDAGRSYTPPPPIPDVPEELEVTLPLGKYAGNYDDGLMPPPEARQDLLEHRRKSGEILAPERSAYADTDEREASLSAPAPRLSRPPGEVSFEPPPLDLSFQPPAREQATVPAPRTEERGLTPSHVAVRGSLSGLSAAEFSGSLSRPQAPKTFMEILDESLRLGD